jgi:hypothetical protein
MRKLLAASMVLAFLIAIVPSASAAPPPGRGPNPRPSVEILGVQPGTEPGPEGELEHVFSIDAYDPNGIITEVIVQFGDNSIAFAHTYCVIFGPGEVAHMQIGHAYQESGTYTVRAWAISVPECSEFGFEHSQESRPDVERFAITVA